MASAAGGHRRPPHLEPSKGVVAVEDAIVVVPHGEHERRAHDDAEGEMTKVDRLVPFRLERLLHHSALLLRLAEPHDHVRVGCAAPVGCPEPAPDEDTSDAPTKMATLRKAPPPLASDMANTTTVHT